MTQAEAWATVIAAVGAVAALATVIGPDLRALGRHGRYNRWLEIANNAAEPPEKALALRRARYYFVEIAAIDITRTRRMTLTGYGIALYILGLGCLWLIPAFAFYRTASAYIPLGLALAFYIGGFLVLQRRAPLMYAVRTAVANEIYTTSEYVGEMRALRYLRPDEPQGPRERTQR